MKNHFLCMDTKREMIEVFLEKAQKIFIHNGKKKIFQKELLKECIDFSHAHFEQFFRDISDS